MIVTEPAESDISEAQAYYQQRHEGLGDDFVRRVGQVLRQIERMPESHRVLYREVRRALIRRFPFSIYYRIENDEPVILAVIHSSRDPDDWKSRI